MNDEKYHVNILWDSPVSDRSNGRKQRSNHIG